jgi:hypothetical protein
MKYTKRVFCLVALIAAISLVPARAQSQFVGSSTSIDSGVASPSALTDDQDSVLTIKKRVDEVNVLFIATDKHGKFVRNLNETDFNILDDHKPPQSIISFKGQTDLPLELGLLIDTSGSVNSRFDFEQEAATASTRPS